jgi:hypothetical protein
LNELLGGDASRLLDTDLCTGKSCISHRQTVLSSQFVFACYIAKYLVGMLFSVDLFSMLHVPWRFACIGLEDTSVTPISQKIAAGLVDGRQSVLCEFVCNFLFCLYTLAHFETAIHCVCHDLAHAQPLDAISWSAAPQSVSPTILPAIQAFKQSQSRTVPAAHLLRMISDSSSGGGRVDLDSSLHKQSRSASAASWVAGPIHSSSCHTQSAGFQRRTIPQIRPQSPSSANSASISIHSNTDPVDLACCVGCVESFWSSPSLSYQSAPATLPSSPHVVTELRSNGSTAISTELAPSAFAADSSNRRFADMLAVSHEVVL